MLPQLASTAASFTRASSLVLKAGTDAHIYDDPHDADIVRLLDSKFDAEKIDGLKRLLALISQGFDVSTFFPQVVKSIASSNLEVKKLVYIYLVQYAEKRPDEALLSINTFQKDLVDFNPLVRAWALRTMCGIQVHAVAPLMIMAVKKCAKDPSPYVRRCAANAIPKLYALNKEQHTDVLEELIDILLGDKSAGVLSAAAAAFNAVCPDRFEIISSRFQQLCRLLTDVEEWGQVLLADILLRYVVAAHGYPGAKEGAKVDGEDHIPQDRTCLLRTTRPLLWSNNSSVVLAAAGIHWILAPTTELVKIVKPLLFLLRSSNDSQFVVLANLLTLVKKNPSLFEDYYDDFFVRSSDNHHVRAMKLEVLSLIATNSSIAAILQELQAYIRDPDRDFAATAVSVIGKCAVRHPATALTCMEGLLSLVQKGCKISSIEQGTSGEDRDASVTIQAVLAIRSVASEHFKLVEKVCARLICDLDLISVTTARAVIIWMVGEYSSKSSVIMSMLPPIISYLASCFIHEEKESKLQILTCITKILVQSWEDLGPGFEPAVLALGYMLDLGLCDSNYDVRDRARMLKHIVSLKKETMAADNQEVGDSLSKVSFQRLPFSAAATLTEDAKHALKSLPSSILTFSESRSLPMPSSNSRTFLLGSMSHIVNHSAPGYRPLPEPYSLTALPSAKDNGSVCVISSSDLVLSSKERHQECVEESDFSGSSASFLSSSDAEDEITTSQPHSAYNKGTESQTSENGSISTNDSTNIEGSFQGKLNSCDQNIVAKPLICLSDNEDGSNTSEIMEHVDTSNSLQIRSGLRNTEDLESWLTTDSFLRKQSSVETSSPSGILNLSMNSIKREPRKMTLLDFTNGDGLEVKYSFCFENPVYDNKMVWAKLYLTNRSSLALCDISLKKEELEVEDPRTLVCPSPTLDTLRPRQVQEFDIYMDFQQQLVPVKLAICCSQKLFLVKLIPDIGAFLRPKEMSFEEFKTAESKLVGMFKMTNRCSVAKPMRGQCLPGLDAEEEALATARVLATRVLSQVNVFLVAASMAVCPGGLNEDALSVDLKFSGETLVSSSLCLITITLEPKKSDDVATVLPVLVKVNCEDSMLGTNLLARLQKSIIEKQ